MRSVVAFLGIALLAGSTALAEPPESRAESVNAAISLSDYTLTNWSEEQGPFPFGIYAIAQDRDGYLWVGARTGLVRFDGSKFAIWKGRQPLPDDRVAAITAARDGSLWIGFGTLGGVAQIVGENVRQFTPRDGLAEGDINAIVEQQDGTIVVATHSGLSEYDGRRWRIIAEDQGLTRTPVISLRSDADGALWAGTSMGVRRRAAGDRHFVFVDEANGGVVGTDLAGSVWVTDPHVGFRQIGLPRSREGRATGRSAAGRELVVDRDGSLWIATRGGGVMHVSGNSRGVHPEQIEHLTRRQGLISDEIRCLFQDRDGNLWIGSRGGLSRLAQSNIRAVLREDGAESFVAAVAVTRDGSEWTATATGLTRVSGTAKRTFAEPDGLPSRIVTALHEDQRGTLWAATALGVARFAGDRFVALAMEPGGSERAYQIRSMTSQSDGALWLCEQSRGLFRWQDGVMTNLDALLGQRKAYVVFTDRADRVWVGFWEGGVSVYDDGNIVNYSTADGLPQGSVSMIFEDQSHGVWVATDHALGRVDGKRIKTFASNGFPQSAVVSMIEDQKGELWIGMGPSLMRISPHEFALASTDPAYQLRYRLYGAEDGLPGTLGRPGMPSAARASDGRLLFVTSIGLAEVDPVRLHDRPAPRLIRVDSVSANGQSVEVRDTAVTLPAGTTRLAFNYSVLSLASSTSRFRYKLEGFDPDWQYAGERREASYTNLPPGPYAFRIASHHDGAWIEASAPLAMSILPAFTQTKTFSALVASSLIVMLWFAWRLHVRHIKREFDLVVAERTRVGREIHDTLLQSLVAVALEFDDISEQLDPAKAALKNQVINIRTRVEQYILEARQSISNLRSPMLVRSDLVTTLKRSGEAATSNRGIRFEFALQGMARRLDETLEEQLLRIGQEAVSNAVRHGRANTILMELVFDHGSVRLRVSDDGCGFDPDRSPRPSDAHWGIAGMRERAAKVGAELRLVSHPGAGTTVEALVSDVA